MTIQELLQIEPRLQGIIDCAHYVREKPDFKPQRYWAGHQGRFFFRKAVFENVGWGSDNPRLKSSEAYLCFYQHIRGILFGSKLHSGKSSQEKNEKLYNI